MTKKFQVDRINILLHDNKPVMSAYQLEKLRKQVKRSVGCKCEVAIHNTEVNKEPKRNKMINFTTKLFK